MGSDSDGEDICDCNGRFMLIDLYFEFLNYLIIEKFKYDAEVSSP